MKNSNTQRKMRPIKVGKNVSRNVRVPVDIHWKIFRQLVLDLGFRDPSSTVVATSDDWHRPQVRFDNDLLFDVIRRRDTQRLMELIPRFEPRRMLNRLGAEKASAYTFFAHYQVGAFLKKFPFKGSDTKTPAIAAFKKYERKCFNFNRENFRALIRLNSSHPKFFGIIEEVRDDIQRLIGKLPDIDRIGGHAKHGPGVSLGPQYRNGKVTNFYKWRNLPYSVTSHALPYAKRLIETDPQWIGALMDWYRSRLGNRPGHNSNQTRPIDMHDFWSRVFKVVDASKIATVPKTALTDRTIAIEAVLNVFLQLGVDQVFRSKLKRWNIDIDDQSINNRLALEASLTNLFATLDLRGASDTITTMICRIFLPEAWYNLLLDLRSPNGSIEGKSFPFEKMSSMGNGFTFALETLIFSALTRAAVRRTKSEHRYAVYGDDIIVPSTAASYLIELLELSGFEVNTDKSFVSGPFRESCGTDYYLGVDVRPVFLKKQLNTVQSLLYLHNSIFELAERSDWRWQVNFDKTLALIRKYLPLPVKRQFWGPPTEALDTHLFTNKKLLRDEDGRSFYFSIIPRAETFTENDFFFRKMMRRPSGNSQNRWKKFFSGLVKTGLMKRGYSRRIERLLEVGRYDSGNAFTVTRRDNVRWRCHVTRIAFRPIPSAALNKNSVAKTLADS